MSKGVIYVCSTVVEGLIKIGKTTDFESRMSNLENNGYRNVTGLKRAFAIEVDNYDDIEILLDDLFAKSRVGGTELFSLDINKVIQLLSAFKGKQIYPVSETQEEVFKEATDAAQSITLIPNGVYTCSIKCKIDGKIYSGKMVYSNGALILKAGSTLAPIKTTCTNSWVQKRRSFGEGPVTLQQDLNCSSVSVASNYISGHETNGWALWKDKDGNPIDIYRQKAKAEED